jgi:hypothetical protein
MLTPTIRLLIELDPVAVPIAGTLQRQPDGDVQPFIGWLQLTENLEAIRRSATRHPDRQAAP